MKIAILDDYQDVVRDLACFRLLDGQDVKIFNETDTDINSLAEKLSDIEALVLIRERTEITEQLLARLPNLKLISQTGKVSSHIDPKLCREFGVDVAEGVGSPIAPAELCWALIMAASRNIPSYVSNLVAGEWQQSGPLGLGRTLNGLTMGIWGYGKIGQQIARYAQAFEMRVLVWGSELSRSRAIDNGLEAAGTKTEFFQSSDIVTLHLRLNDATRHCVTRSDLEQMKNDSLFVNTSRADLVEPNALFTEMKKHPTRRAAIDVYETEPADRSTEPLLGLPNVLCSPHLGFVERNSYELYFRAAFENVIAYFTGRPQNLVQV